MKNDTNNGSNNTRSISLFWMAILFPVLIFCIVMWGAKAGSLGFNELPSLEQLENPKSNLASQVITADGKVIGKYFKENRTNINYEDLSPHLINALIATEDERFLDHSGIDLRGLVRAVINLGTAGGASTITQQLAKMMFNDPAKNKIERAAQKLQEWILAVELEKRYTKQEIISMYYNKFDFIYNAVGIQSGSNVYFNKEPKDLLIEEAAVLVGMAKNPSLYNPKRFPENALKRREVVLHQMKRSQLISQEEYDSLRILPLTMDYKVVDHKEGLAPYFRETLRLELQELLAQKDASGNYIYTKKDGTKYDIYRDGLKIYTTLDSRMQEYAEWAVKEYLGGSLQKQFSDHLRKYRRGKYPFDNKISKREYAAIMKRAQKRTKKYRVLAGKECANCGRRGKNLVEEEGYHQCLAEDCGEKRKIISADSISTIFDTKIKMKVFSHNGEIDTLMSPNDSIKYYKSFLQAGLMSVEPQTGYIKAWVGGIDYKSFAFDHVKASKRQVGSTFKPFVYAAAIQNGYSPCYRVTDTKYTFHKGEFGILKDWTPKNSDGETGCNVSLKYALANSMNTITAWIMKQFGPQAVISQARAMGITSKLDPVPALCLGVADLTVYEMVGANATLANKGVWVEPTMYTRVEDKNGNVIIDVLPKTNEALSEEAAYVMLNLMKGVVEGVKNNCSGKITGTGQRLRGAVSERRPYAGHHYPIAGKTGTTQNNSDGWFMGLTPDLVTGVWVGAEERSIRFARTDLGQGANTALPIWGYYMKKVHQDSTINISKGDFEKPKNDISIELDCSEYELQDNSITPKY